MDYDPAPEPTDPTIRLSRDVYYMAVHTLRGTLEMLRTGTPEEIARRDHAAIAQACHRA